MGRVKLAVQGLSPRTRGNHKVVSLLLWIFGPIPADAGAPE